MTNFKKKIELIEAFFEGRAGVGDRCGNMRVSDRFILNSGVEYTGEEDGRYAAEVKQSLLLYHDNMLLGIKSSHRATYIRGLPYRSDDRWPAALVKSKEAVQDFCIKNKELTESWHGNLKVYLLRDHEQGTSKHLKGIGTWYCIGGNQLISHHDNILVKPTVDEKLLWSCGEETIEVGGTFGIRKIGEIRMDQLYESLRGQAGVRDGIWYIREDGAWWRAGKKPQWLLVPYGDLCAQCGTEYEDEREVLCGVCGGRRLRLHRGVSSNPFLIIGADGRSKIESRPGVRFGERPNMAQQVVPHILVDPSVVGKEIHTWDELRPYILGRHTGRGVRKRITDRVWEEIKGGAH